MPALPSRTAALLAALLLAAATRMTSAAPPPAQLIHRSYPVADLIMPVSPVEVDLGKGTATSTAVRKPQPTGEKKLIELIVQTIHPESWEQNGGQGAIRFFPLGLGLDVTQTAAIQEEIAHLLAALRRQRDIEVALEVRVLTTAEEFGERGALNPAGREAVKDRSGTLLLSAEQTREVLTALQGDRRCNTVQTPRVTLMDGQPATFNLMDTQHLLTGLEAVESAGQADTVLKSEPVETGIRLKVEPVVSADRHSVRLRMRVESRDLIPGAPPQGLGDTTPSLQASHTTPEGVRCEDLVPQPELRTRVIEKTVVIPDGGSALLRTGTKEVEVRKEFCPEWLRQFPCVGRLFTTVGYSREPRLTFVLVTPRIIVNEEPVPQPPAGVDARDSSSAGEPVSRQAKVLAALLTAYEEACAAGKGEEAEKFARAALIIEPRCFQRNH